MCFEIVKPGFLFHAPDLKTRKLAAKFVDVPLNLAQILTFKVISSEQEAKICPWGSHLIALTSFWWPTNVLTGLSILSRQTWMHWSVEQLANVVLSFQSTSNAGAWWKANCWVQWPVPASHIIVVLSTPALSI